ncbi:hypothetical protein JCM15548_112 [Geofilum rubicundum JCM 15548]|uniref:Uncharacterized protein n=1 Tax=Geofilum rubicundum JCM 15548 TaxID=1236989 RepID=A0A0E9LS27_9BACT|nr:hypothetical protein JCM15548_112 [Geofilum rubicundum JCM 15548]
MSGAAAHDSSAYKAQKNFLCNRPFRLVMAQQQLHLNRRVGPRAISPYSIVEKNILTQAFQF